jgi:hypothetical protein
MLSYTTLLYIVSVVETVKTKKRVRRGGEDVDWSRPRIAPGKKQNRKIVPDQRLDDASA